MSSAIPTKHPSPSAAASLVSDSSAHPQNPSVTTPAALTRGGLGIGPNPSADCERGGKQPGYVVFGGQKIPVNTDSRLRSSVPVQLRG
jgi:hypothetical protein